MSEAAPSLPLTSFVEAHFTPWTFYLCTVYGGLALFLGAYCVAGGLAGARRVGRERMGGREVDEAQEAYETRLRRAVEHKRRSRAAAQQHV